MLLSVSAPVLLSIKKSDLCRWLYSKYCFSHINFVRFSTWIFSDFAGGNQKGNRNIFHICSSSFWLSTKKSVWCFPMLQNISFSGISFWWLTWDTEPRARDTCRSPQIQQADQLCNVQWITLPLTFMHKWAKEKKKNKTTKLFQNLQKFSLCRKIKFNVKTARYCWFVWYCWSILILTEVLNIL